MANYGSSTVSVLPGNGDGTFGTQVTYPTGSNPYDVVAVDLNGDGKLDLATANYGSGNDVSVLLNQGVKGAALQSEQLRVGGLVRQRGQLRVQDRGGGLQRGR